MSNHFTFYISVLLLISGLSACDRGDNKSAEKKVIQPVHRINISSDEFIFDKRGDRVELSARAYNAGGETVQVMFLWASSSPEYISVNPQTGEVAALKAGSSKITASVQGVVSNPLRVMYRVLSKKVPMPKPLSTDSVDMNSHERFYTAVDLTVFKKGEISLADKEVCHFDGYVVNAKWLSGYAAKIISDKRVLQQPITLNSSEFNVLDEEIQPLADFHGQDIDVTSDLADSILSSQGSLSANTLEKDDYSSVSIKPIFEYDDLRNEFLDLGISGTVTLFFQ